MKKVISLLVIVLMAASVYAGPRKTTTVEKIRVRASVAYVKLAGCNKYNRVYLDTEYGKAMLSVAMMAAAAGKTVSVEFNEATGCSSVESEFVFFEVTS
jgi:hypothetical protein